ncbi:hypothetical protein LTR53_007441 [Teratosphaeriaceae sp. CCFEE 6253]|nr:hypothetical protein LTR53_007441 [Teratosphaeriaceae sp. CCFEE 6253]
MPSPKGVDPMVKRLTYANLQAGIPDLPADQWHRARYTSVVDVIVGWNKTKFCVHPDVLSRFCPYFEAEIARWRQAGQPITLTHGDPTIFELYLQVVYDRDLPVAHRAMAHKGVVRDLLDLYIMADKFGDLRVGNIAIDRLAIILMEDESDILSDLAMVLEAWDTTPPSSPLHKLLVDAYLAEGNGDLVRKALANEAMTADLVIALAEELLPKDPINAEEQEPSHSKHAESMASPNASIISMPPGSSLATRLWTAASPWTDTAESSRRPQNHFLGTDPTSARTTLPYSRDGTRPRFTAVADVLVGQDAAQTRFHVHTSVIRKHWPYLAAEMQRCQTTGAPIRLPHEDPDTFALYLETVYHARHLPLHARGAAKHDMVQQMLRMYVLADNLGDLRTGNWITNLLWITLRTRAGIPVLADLDMVLRAWEATPRDSPLRKLLVAALTRRGGEETLREVLARPEMTRDLAVALALGLSSGSREEACMMSQARRGRPGRVVFRSDCRFHQHDAKIPHGDEPVRDDSELDSSAESEAEEAESEAEMSESSELYESSEMSELTEMTEGDEDELMDDAATANA